MTCKSCGGSDHSQRNSKRCSFYKPRRNVKLISKKVKRANHWRSEEDKSQLTNLLNTLPVELKKDIAHLLDLRSIVRLSMVDQFWKNFLNDGFWEHVCRKRGWKPEERPSHPKQLRILPYKNLVVSFVLKRCVLCLLRKKATACFSDSDLLICRSCGFRVFNINVTEAKRAYILNDYDLEAIPFIQLWVPASRRSVLSTLYSERGVLAVAHKKYGGREGLEEAREKSWRWSRAIIKTREANGTNRKLWLKRQGDDTRYRWWHSCYGW
ncbi:uncharacterized protein EV422DRAFT_372234 [Fimicolochytrium jonesii]|uniref:uncharacterized protein n=1 Tax=Fimicolochytrium jonesii TaxID=1396493 RepID=UPI0022FE1890|nr:uncharacterized protein EV422DRAFT_372234 [Fimicolochytrium jonesii]KAI8815543.1 hypothetical protein EV422DRAFT_372234 [Fimicolochytrium jonesii]